MTSLSPNCSAEVSWVYGYQAEKSKNNLRYTSSKGQCIAYHVGRYGVVYGFDSHKQSIFSGHQHEILCLSIHTVPLPSFSPPPHFPLLSLLWSVLLGRGVGCHRRVCRDPSPDRVEHSDQCYPLLREVCPSLLSSNLA
jgi:hypothetical protein